MSLSAFALRHKPIVVTAMAVLMLWGVLSYNSMPRREDPEYVVRACQVLTQWRGTPTEQVEELITAPLEEEINTLDGIRWVKSETSVGRSSIIVELDRDTPGNAVEQMWDKVRSRVERVTMPEPGIVPLVIDDFGDTNIMLLAVHQRPLSGEPGIRPENRYSPRQLDIFSGQLADEIKLQEGVAKVTRIGVREEAIYLETDLGTWTQLSLRTDELESLVSQRNVIAAGGEIDTDTGRFSVKPSGDLDAVSELESIVVGTVGEGSGRAPVQLADLGLEVVRGYVDPAPVLTRVVLPDGAIECVVIAFAMKGGDNIVDVCARARAVVERMTVQDKVLPPDLAVTTISDQSVTVTRKIDDFILNVAGAILIVVIVVYLMVGLRSSLVMAANIPLVVIGSLALITIWDVQLEQISLAAMIIALGMLVDNAVQICDQARRLQQEGLSPADAAQKGAEQLSFPMLIATGTTVAAFYPMLIGLQGSTNEYIRSLPITLTVILILSWVMAMTFCVLLAAWFIRVPDDPDTPSSPVIALWQRMRGKPKTPASATAPTQSPAPAVTQAPTQAPGKGGGLADIYPALARVCIHRRVLVIVGSFVLLFLVMGLPVGSEFFPRDMRDQFAVEVWLPEGASIDQTDAAVRSVEQVMRALGSSVDAEGRPVERLAALVTCVGRGLPRWYMGRNPEAPRPNYAEIVVRTTSGQVTAGFAADVRRVCEQGDAERGLQPVTSARVIPRQLVMGPNPEAPVGIRIFGPRQGAEFADRGLMQEQARKVVEIARARPGAWDVYETWGSPAYQLHVDIDEDKANLAGVTNVDVARTLNAYYSGHKLTTFREGDHLVPVYLRLPPEQRATLDGLGGAFVEGRKGKVPLDAVATLEARWEPARVDRRFLQRVIEVRARVEDGFRANDIVLGMLATDEFAQWEAQLPPGYWWEVGGELFESKQSKDDLSVSLVISILAIILLLIIQYNGIAKPLIILTTLPLALIGAVLGLYLTGNAMGFMPQLGVLSLFGIVVNTAIIFIEFADILIADKAAASDGSGPIMGLTVTEFRECLVQAGQVRLLPIAMTTLTTIGGLLPLALAGGPLWEGMAWLMISGLIVATLLTLVIVPALYALFVENFGMRPVPEVSA